MTQTYVEFAHERGVSEHQAQRLAKAIERTPMSDDAVSVLVSMAKQKVTTTASTRKRCGELGKINAQRRRMRVASYDPMQDEEFAYRAAEILERMTGDKCSVYRSFTGYYIMRRDASGKRTRV